VKQHLISYHNVPRETFLSIDRLIEAYKPQLDKYIQSLLWWNKRINLISRNVSRGTVVNHIHHSLLVTQLDAYTKADYIVDAGTGGGLPGIPLAITSPDKQFLLNDIISKKIRAVKQMTRDLSLSNIDTFDRSIGELKTPKPHLLLSKHAFKIDELYRFAKELPWEKMAFYKGVDFKEELENIEGPLEVIVYKLSPNSNDGFYKGKAIVMLSR
jgi:16S rRNA (guanine527-N7)-methyltransferase